LTNPTVNALAVSGANLFAGTDGGVFLSTNNGTSWTAASTGLTNTFVNALAVSGTNLFAGTSGGGVWINSSYALPVELTSFTASVIHNTVGLKWNTATEVNNYGFEIERSEKLKVKNEKWERIGFVEGSGTTNAPKEYSFTDKNLTAGKNSYRLKQIDRDGQFKYSESVEVTVSSPTVIALEQNFPNPFNPSTTIRYALPSRSSAKIVVTNTLGQEVAVLTNGEQEAGYHEVEWRANVASGIYFYRIDAVSASDPNNRFVQVKKMLLLK
jgi:hypothetical protein